MLCKHTVEVYVFVVLWSALWRFMSLLCKHTVEVYVFFVLWSALWSLEPVL